MQFTHYDMGFLNRGQVVEITLRGSAANVRLMDSGNLSAYRSGRRHRFYGGLMKTSPAHIPVPHSGHWHVTVDMQGLRGSTRSSVRMLPAPLPPLPPLREEIPLASMPGLARDIPSDSGGKSPGNKQYDVFISHASEDKESVVRPLVEALTKHDLTVWYDDFELKLGSSLRRTIDHGIANSRFGIVVLSHAFFGKEWPDYELDGLVTRDGGQTILPVWHNVSKQEVMSYSASLADKVARNTATSTVDEIAAEIAEVIRSKDGK